MKVSTPLGRTLNPTVELHTRVWITVSETAFPEQLCGEYKMVVYTLSHLTQPETQAVLGPIQDDEALLLYSIVRGMRLKRILEIGGLSGYSATNFLAALPADGVVYTVDINPVTSRDRVRHRTLCKDAHVLDAADVDTRPLDMVFFDCHVYDAQMALFHRLRDQGIITDRTVLALHDTNTHPYQVVPWAYETADGWVHQPVERRMLNEFVEMGYHALCLHTQNAVHSAQFPYRHGVSVLQKFTTLAV
jgi:protein-L-isoaspartate O-methyltransferase